METIAPGTPVRVQNQDGPYLRRWQGTGTVTEALPFKQYRVKMDGTGKPTVRNRQFIFPVVSPWKKLQGVGHHVQGKRKGVRGTQEQKDDT